MLTKVKNKPLLSSLLAAAVVSGAAQAEPGKGQGQPSAKAAAVFAHWTNEKRKAAQPRDLVIDSRGLGYLKAKDGKLTPYGHTVAAAAGAKEPQAKPPSNGDTTPPDVSNQIPGANATIGASQTFSATVTDASDVKSVTFLINLPSGSTQSFTPGRSGDIYSINLEGFTDSELWSWQVQATDNARRGGNRDTTDPLFFTVDTGDSGVDPVDPGDGGGTGNTITNAPWTTDGPVQLAAGRIYFEMPTNSRLKRWAGYVCSGTVVNDGSTDDRSIILTAAHCVYDDANKAFARNVLFIPDQDNTSGTGTDGNCTNDPIGCWAPDFGVVDTDWTSAVFPYNIPWDYAYYVVPDSNAHTAGENPANDALDQAVTPMTIDFGDPDIDGQPLAFTHALGYSYSEDPNFMYCAEVMTREGSANWWLPSCGLSGGSSGGPWTQSTDDNLGTGPVMSVNSWGYTGSPGMAGPQLNTAGGSTAACLFDIAKQGSVNSNARDGRAGIAGC